jgi:hypothetical protein
MMRTCQYQQHHQQQQQRGRTLQGSVQHTLRAFTYTRDNEAAAKLSCQPNCYTHTMPTCYPNDPYLQSCSDQQHSDEDRALVDAFKHVELIVDAPRIHLIQQLQATQGVVFVATSAYDAPRHACKS